MILVPRWAGEHRRVSECIVYHLDQLIDGDPAVSVTITYAAVDEQYGSRRARPPMTAEAAIGCASKREAQAMVRLGDHPHIVTVYDIGEENGALYIVSQYMAAGSVEDLLRQSGGSQPPAVRNVEGSKVESPSVGPRGGAPLPVDHALRIAAQICAALEHAHACNVLHRDLKPGNVWLMADGTAKLGDFGLALSLAESRLTQQGMMIGTVAYMAPEQAVGGEVTAQSDLYALGALLYELLTGRADRPDKLELLTERPLSDPPRSGPNGSCSRTPPRPRL